MTQPRMSGATLIGTRTFTDEDQRAFALLSRDWNPMHMDAVAARRLLSGRQVVHGIHALIHALELWQYDGPPRVLQVSCNFANTLNVGDPVVFSQFEDDGGRTRLVATVNGLSCTEITIEPKGVSSEEQATAPDVRAASSHPRRIGALSSPLDETAGSQTGLLIEVDPCVGTLASTFPRAAALLGSEGLSDLACLSFFVGMVCPGLHSVFSSVTFHTGASSRQPLRFEVRKYDPRFRLFTVGFDGAVRGELRAFQRPPPHVQARAGEVASHLDGTEFKGTRSLVIGGSRGLGETVAKIVAAGGGDVVVSYAAGREDAAAVAADINGNGRGQCSAVHLDLSRSFPDTPDLDPAGLDTVYFFATPRIYAKRKELFSRSAFDEFVGFYLQRFYELCLWLESAKRVRPVKVYLPSTVFISERPKGMTEYAMAKAAAEVLADDLNRSLRHVRVVHTRLPRLATDQTASILNVSVSSNVDAMLAVVRQMEG